MRRLRLLGAVLAALAVVATAWGGNATPAVAAGSSVQITLLRAVKDLPVAAETRAGYDRAKFRLWVDADHDCRDTRDEVLAVESLVRVSGCDIQRGLWRSYYDGVLTRDSSGFDIDHLVPLAEAWDSGAKRWNAATRERYANDLGDPRTLVAVTASANRSKSDQDPAEWLPELARCKYVRQWVAVKIRWSLTVDRTEKRALMARATDCANMVITVRRATIGTGSSTGSTGTTGSGGGGGTGGTGGTDPRFSYCYQAIAAGYGPYYQGRDTEYTWYTDSDHDGIVCES
jgi:hypothetical protein